VGNVGNVGNLVIKAWVTNKRLGQISSKSVLA